MPRSPERAAARRPSPGPDGRLEIPGRERDDGLVVFDPAPDCRVETGNVGPHVREARAPLLERPDDVERAEERGPLTRPDVVKAERSKLARLGTPVTHEKDADLERVAQDGEGEALVAVAFGDLPAGAARGDPGPRVGLGERSAQVRDRPQVRDPETVLLGEAPPDVDQARALAPAPRHGKGRPLRDQRVGHQVQRISALRVAECQVGPANGLTRVAAEHVPPADLGPDRHE